MGKWADRLAEIQSAPHLSCTDKTDETGVVSVLAVPRQWLRAGLPPQEPPLPAQVIGPYSLSRADADRAHAEPWDDATIRRFVARMGLFLRRGLNATDADDLAERLHLRDVEFDARAMCLECQHLAGSASTGWRCRNACAAGIGADLPAEMVTKLQRCEGFDDR